MSAASSLHSSLLETIIVNDTLVIFIYELKERILVSYQQIWYSEMEAKVGNMPGHFFQT